MDAQRAMMSARRAASRHEDTAVTPADVARISATAPESIRRYLLAEPMQEAPPPAGDQSRRGRKDDRRGPSRRRQ
jgi:hypothetical protein